MLKQEIYALKILEEARMDECNASNGLEYIAFKRLQRQTH